MVRYMPLYCAMKPGNFVLPAWRSCRAWRRTLRRVAEAPQALGDIRSSKVGLENSPSLGMSMPTSACLRTTSARPRDLRLERRLVDRRPADLPQDVRRGRPSGRTRLPTWVVRMRSVLRCIGYFLIWTLSGWPAGRRGTAWVCAAAQSLGLREISRCAPGQVGCSHRAAMPIS